MWWRCSVVLGLVLWATVAVARGQSGYRIIDLGAMTPMAVNNTGMVVGYDPQALAMAFTLAKGAFYLDDDGVARVPTGVNDRGTIIYNGGFDETGARPAWIRRPGIGLDTLAPLNETISETYATGINNVDMVVGGTLTTDEFPIFCPLRWANPDAVPVCLPDEDVDGGLLAVNNKGLAVGHYARIVNNQVRLVSFTIDQGNRFRELKPYAIPYDVNDVGWVVGARGRVWFPNGKSQVLGHPRSDCTETDAYAINKSSHIAGDSRCGGVDVAWIWTGRFSVLQTLVAGWRLHTVHDMNDARWVIGVGTHLSSGQLRGYLLLPKSSQARDEEEVAFEPLPGEALPPVRKDEMIQRFVDFMEERR